jgi:hypothetical protein
MKRFSTLSVTAALLFMVTVVTKNYYSAVTIPFLLIVMGSLIAYVAYKQFLPKTMQLFLLLVLGTHPISASNVPWKTNQTYYDYIFEQIYRTMDVCTRTVSDVTCGGFPKSFLVGGGLLYNGNWIGVNFLVSSGTLTEDTNNGTAVLTMRVCGDSNSGACMDITMNLSGYTTSNSDPHLGGMGECLTLSGPGPDWYYYSSYNGTAVGVSGALLGFSATINGTGGDFQIGTSASLYDNSFGASGWFNGTNNASGSWTGDFNFNLSNPANCQSACSITTQSATPTACDPATNTYNLAVTVSYSGQPTGDITINVGGTDYTFTPDGTSPDTYTVMGLISNGTQNIDVSATFVGDPACTDALIDAYDAPANCFCPTSTCLLNASFFQDIVLGFDGSLYTSEGTVNMGACTIDGSYDMTMDAAGNIYVSSSLTNTVVKFDNAGNCLGEFITAGSGGLNNPRGLTFLPNGDLLVNSHNSGQILRYNGTTGAYIGVFSNGSDISPTASMAPHMTIKYGPDGAVWVADHTNNRILRFNATTGAFLSVFAQLPNGSGVRSFEFFGNYVLISRHNVDVVAMYNYNTGAYIGNFANAADGLDGPTGITYGPDGKVYIGSLNSNQILVFDALGTLLTTISVNSPKDILFKCGECFTAACALTVDSAIPTTCNPATNTYNLAVTVTYSNPPTGNITINVGGTDYTFTPDGTSPDTYTVTGLTSDGTQDIDVSATFVGDAACTDALVDAYDAPASCPTGSINCPSGCTGTPQILAHFTFDAGGAPESGIAPDVVGSCVQVGDMVTTTNSGSDAEAPDEPVCSGAGSICVGEWDDDPSSYVSFTVTLPAGTCGTLGSFSFCHSAPIHTIPPGNSSLEENDYPQTWNVGVYQGGVLIPGAFFTGNAHNPDWTDTQLPTWETNTVDLSGITSDGTSGQTYEIRLSFTNIFNSSGDKSIVEMDEFILDGCCGTPTLNPCSITVDSAIPTACSPATNTYDLAVNVSYADQPSGDITINIGGTDYTFTPDGTSPDTYTVTGLTSDGTQDIDVSATFVGDATCTDALVDAYDAPASCSQSLCPIPALWAINEDDGHLFIVSDWTSTAGVNSTAYDWGLIQWSDDNCVTKTNINISGGSELESAAWDRITNEYYFTSNKDLGSYNAPVLLKIDVDDLVAGQQPCALVVGSISSSGQEDIESLAMDPITNELYGGSKDNGRLYKIDKTNAAIISGYPMQMTKPSPLSGNLNDSESMTFDNSGNLYVSETDDEDVYIINKTTGAGISVFDGNTAGLGLDGITWDFVNNRLIGFEDKSLSTNESLIYEITSGNGSNIVLSDTYDAGLVDIEGLELMCPVAIGCDITVDSAIPTTCNPATNTYNLAVTVTYSNPPTGNITINVGGTDYTFTPDGTSPDTYTVTGLTSDGTQDIDVSATFVGDAACTDALVDAYDAPASCACSISLSETNVDVLCNGGMTGSIDVTVSGAQGSVSYVWSDGATTEDRSGLAAGTYSVTATDAGNCQDILSVEISEPTALAPVCDATDVTTTGGSDGTASVSVSGGTPSYTYLWNTGATTASVSGLAAGTYHVTVTDANGCTSTCASTVNEPGCGLSLSETNVDVLCNGGMTGSIDVTVSGAQGSVSYVWSDGATTEDRSGLAAGTYSVTATDAGNCQDILSVEISEPTALAPVCDATDVTTTGGSDGTASVSVSGGTPSYTYLWNTGATTASVSGLAAGTYHVTVTDANGCTSTCASTVNEPGCGLSLSETNVDVLCNGGMTGSIDVTVSGAQGSVSYVWSDGATTEDRSGLAAGTYSVTATDAGNCQDILSVEISEPTALAPVCDATDVTTTGGSDGTASVSVSGGTPSYTYLWNTGATTASVSGLAAGTYHVTVTDANGCTSTCASTVNEPGCGLSLSETNVDVLCNGGMTGSIDVTVSGAQGSVSYVWSDGATTEDRSGLAAGTYSVTATDAGNCQDILSVEISEPTALAPVCDATDVTTTGGSDGTASVSVSGGTPSYTYLWNTGATTASVSGLAAGTYHVTVTDANGCTSTCASTVNEPGCGLSLSETNVDVLCNGGMTGSIDVTVSGAQGSVSYVWSDGATTEDRSGLAAGTYSVTATDAGNCQDILSVEISEPTALAPVCDATDVTTTGGSDGTASVSVSGGTPSYTYLWNTGATTASVSGLAAGTYHVTVTDANGCTSTCASTVNEPGCGLSLSETNVDVLCNGGMTGSIDVTVSGAQGSVSYVWSDGATTEDRSGLAAGTYSVTATDAGNCQDILSVEISEPTALAPVCDATDVTTTGGSDGTASVSVSGGTPSYTYLWNTGATTASVSGLAAGTYHVTVTDANGCTSTCASTVNEPGCALSLSETNVDVLCNGGMTGSIDVTVSGAQGSVSYVWSDGATTEDRSGLAAGTYSVTATDAGNCQDILSVEISEPTALAPVCDATDVTTTGGSDGTASVSVSGGTPSYTYLWNTGATTASVSGLAAGTYHVTVTDANGCTSTCASTVNEPGCGLSLSETNVDVLCNGGMTGSIDVTASGAQGSVSYVWSDGATTEDRSGLAAGTYSVTATDAGNCQDILSVEISEPTALVPVCDATDVTTTGGSDGTASVSVSGGTPSYTYLWNTGATTASVSGLAAGTYHVTVTDANGCTSTCASTVNEPGCGLSLSETNVDVVCNGGMTGSIDVTVSGAQGSVSYVWSDGATTEDRSGLAAGTYSVTATDAGNCQDILSVEISEPTALVPVCDATDVTTTGGSDGTASVSVSGGTPSYTYLWNTGATTASVSGLAAGTYHVTVTDANGCTSTCASTVNEPGCGLSLSETNVDVLCNGGMTGSIDVTASGAQGSVSYVWSDGATTEDRSGLAAGTYSVTATDAGNCQDILSVEISEPTALAPVCDATDVTTTGGSDGTASVSVSGGTPSYTYLWNTGATTASVSGLAAGTYHVTVTDANGCTSTCASTVNEPGCALSLSETNVDVLCNGGMTGSIDVTASGAQGSVSYVWSDGATTEDRSGLAAGTYSVTATDAGNCQDILSVEISEPTALAPVCDATDVTTTGGSDGTASVSVSGGTPSYTYLWNTGATTASVSGLAAGTYHVTVTDANGCTSTCASTVNEPSPLGSIGNYVWIDTNGDGMQNEPASNGVNGVTVILWSPGPDGVIGGGDDVQLATTITANDPSGNPGYYEFTGLPAGSYYVQFPTNVAGGDGLTTQDGTPQTDGNSDANIATGFSNLVVLNPANGGLDQNNPTIDAGYLPVLGSIGNYVWIDTNGDGMQNEPASNGVNGVTVILWSPGPDGVIGGGDDVQLATTITANDPSGNPGYYEFTGLPAGSYYVQFPTNVAGGDGLTTQDGTPQTDGNSDANIATGFSNLVVLNPANGGLDQNNPTIDAGYLPVLGSIGNYVWIDTNGDGIQNEPASNGVNGVTVILWSPGPDSVIGGGDDVQLATTITANDPSGNPGYYEFTGLPAGSYYVQFPTNVTGGDGLTTQDGTPQTDGNSDANIATGFSNLVVLNPANGGLDQNNTTIDAGYLPVCVKPVLTAGNVECDGTSFYSVEFYSSTTNITASAGTVGAGIITNIPVGTNVTITATSGPNCSTTLTVTSPEGCGGGTCTIPTLTVGQPLCDGTTYTVSVTVSAGATVTASAGTLSGNVISGIPVGTNVTITAVDGVCVTSVIVNSPENCIDPCENPGISLSGPICADNGMSYTLNFTTVSGATVSASAGVVGAGTISGIPSGTDVTITVSVPGCPDKTTFIPAPADCVPLGSIGNYVWIDTNGDGIQNEPASNGVNGVTVILWSPGPDGVIGGGDDVAARLP